MSTTPRNIRRREPSIPSAVQSGYCFMLDALGPPGLTTNVESEAYDP
jgi:hypothetical protein